MALTKVAPAGIGSTPGDGYRIGSSFLHSTGVEITNINATGILTAASLDISGGIDFDGHTELDNVNIAGVVTATTFKGDGSQLTGFTAGQIPNLSGAKITTGTVAAARIDNLAASKITSGTVATARLGSGTASSSTFLRGDGSWAATGAGTGEQFVKLKNSSGALNDGGENVYAGYRAGASLASGANENTFYGTDAGRDCATGDYNVFIGHRAGENSLNSKNTAIGAESLHSQTSGQSNTAVGYQAGIKITTANYNTAVGHMTLSGDGSSHNVTGGSNVVMGYMSGYGISSGEKNVLIGYESGYDMTTGYWNSGLGHQALENVGVGTCNTALGYRAGHTINNGSNNICIGNQVTATASDTSNEITLGNSDITKFRIPGINFVLKDNGGTPSSGQVLTADGSGEGYWAASSGTTINSNADNRIITGSGTANTLNGESSLTFDGTKLSVSTGATVFTNGNIAAGIVTATSFVGDGSGLTGVGASEEDTAVSSTSATTVLSFAKADYRAAFIKVVVTQGSAYQSGKYSVIHDGTTVTVVEENAIATGSMLGSFSGTISGSNVLFQVTMGSASSATVTILKDLVTV